LEKCNLFGGVWCFRATLPLLIALVVMYSIVLFTDAESRTAVGPHRRHGFVCFGRARKRREEARMTLLTLGYNDPGWKANPPRSLERQKTFSELLTSHRA
jgi:hypothetical protein